jgi:hypothetical protein
MRTIAIIIAACAAMLATPASAQSAGDILRTIDSLRYDGCSYASGAYEVACQANRASRVIDTFRSTGSRNQYETAARLERRISLIDALTRACQAGDRHSCQRVGNGVSSDRIVAARALMDACRNGDRFSCERAEAVLVGTDRSFSGATRATGIAREAAEPRNDSPRPTQARIGACIVDIDPATGMRTSGPYGCTR